MVASVAAKPTREAGANRSSGERKRAPSSYHMDGAREHRSRGGERPRFTTVTTVVKRQKSLLMKGFFEVGVNRSDAGRL